MNLRAIQREIWRQFQSSFKAVSERFQSSFQMNLRVVSIHLKQSFPPPLHPRIIYDKRRFQTTSDNGVHSLTWLIEYSINFYKVKINREQSGEWGREEEEEEVEKAERERGGTGGGKPREWQEQQQWRHPSGASPASRLHSMCLLARRLAVTSIKMSFFLFFFKFPSFFFPHFLVL